MKKFMCIFILLTCVLSAGQSNGSSQQFTYDCWVQLTQDRSTQYDEIHLRDGRVLQGRLEKYPRLNYNFCPLDFETEDLSVIAFGRGCKGDKVQFMTYDGLSYMGSPDCCNVVFLRCAPYLQEQANTFQRIGQAPQNRSKKLGHKPQNVVGGRERYAVAENPCQCNPCHCDPCLCGHLKPNYSLAEGNSCLCVQPQPYIKQEHMCDCSPCTCNPCHCNERPKEGIVEKHNPYIYCQEFRAQSTFCECTSTCNMKPCKFDIKDIDYIVLREAKTAIFDCNSTIFTIDMVNGDQFSAEICGTIAVNTGKYVLQVPPQGALEMSMCGGPRDCYTFWDSLPRAFDKVTVVDNSLQIKIPYNGVCTHVLWRNVLGVHGNCGCCGKFPSVR